MTFENKTAETLQKTSEGCTEGVEWKNTKDFSRILSLLSNFFQKQKSFLNSSLGASMKDVIELTAFKLFFILKFMVSPIPPTTLSYLSFIGGIGITQLIPSKLLKGY